MQPSPRNRRFEITLNTDKGSFTHINAAPKQAEAVARVVRVYEGKNSVVPKLKPLGVLLRAANR